MIEYTTDEVIIASILSKLGVSEARLKSLLVCTFRETLPHTESGLRSFNYRLRFARTQLFERKISILALTLRYAMGNECYRDMTIHVSIPEAIGNETALSLSDVTALFKAYFEAFGRDINLLKSQSSQIRG